MPDFAMYGGIFRSELPFPDLRPSAGGEPSWWLRRSADRPPDSAVEVLGEETFEGPVRLAVTKTPTGLRFTYTDTGVFDISDGGRDLVWYPAAGAPLDLARIDVMGRVMAGALHLGGLLCLHGSAVALGAGSCGIGFLAPKHYGKSTLAFAMTQRGAQLLTDDTLPVEFTHPVRLRPGVHSVRLWTDSAERLASDRIGTGREYGGKHIVDWLPKDRIADQAVPLSAIYVLNPPTEQTLPAFVRRARVSDVPAAMALVRHAKIGALLGKSEAPVLFERAVATARAVPVYELDFVRDFAQVDHVVGQLMEWHAMATNTRV